MKTIYKYPLLSGGVVKMPIGASILHAALQGPTTMIWALVDPNEADMEPREFTVRGTGWDMPDDVGLYIATYLDGSFVWHLFETTP